MARAEFKKDKENYRVSTFYNEKPRKKEKSYYWNVIDKDSNKLAQIFLDLYLDGFPILEACNKMKVKLSRKDWMGF